MSVVESIILTYAISFISCFLLIRKYAIVCNKRVDGYDLFILFFPLVNAIHSIELLIRLAMDKRKITKNNILDRFFLIKR